MGDDGSSQLSRCSICAVFLSMYAAALLPALQLLASAGAFHWIDRSNPAGRGLRWRGEVPWVTPTPWRFSAQDIPQLDGRVAIVTGANSGLGFWTASHLAAKGATVIMACRNAAKCKAAADEICRPPECAGGAVPMDLDLARSSSIALFAAAFKSNYDRLDTLVLNAGVMLQPWSLTESGLESTMATNHVGHFKLAQLLMPALEDTAARHGVATVSVHSSAAIYETKFEGGIRMELLQPWAEAAEPPEWHDAFEVYCQSKLANVLFAQELARREREAGHNVLVNSHAPGAVATGLLDHIIGPGGMVEQKAGSTVQQIVLWALTQLVWSARDASLTQVFTAVSDEIRRGNITGKYFQSVAREQLPDPHAANATLQRLLWEATEELARAMTS